MVLRCLIALAFAVISAEAIDLRGQRRDRVLDFTDISIRSAEGASPGDIVTKLFTGAMLPGVHIDLKETPGFVASIASKTVTQEGFVDAITLANLLPTNMFQSHKATDDFQRSVTSTTYGSTFAFDDLGRFLCQLFQGTSLARYLEPQIDGTYAVISSDQSSDLAMQTLHREKIWNTNLKEYPSSSAELTFALNAQGVLGISGSPSASTMMEVLGAVILAEEVWHAALHFIDGTLNHLVNTRTDELDAVIKGLLAVKSQSTETLFAGVRLLSVVPQLVWEKALPDSLVSAVVKGALLDFSTLYPFAGISEADMQFFKGVIPDVYPQIAKLDFGYGDETIEMFVSTGVTVAAPKNNLCQLRLMIGLVHTDTFVWQQALGADEFRGVLNSKMSSVIFTNVVFPDVPKCVDSTQDVSYNFKKLILELPENSHRAALEQYTDWLKTYRASGLTGLSTAYDSEHCMSVSTWI